MELCSQNLTKGQVRLKQMRSSPQLRWHGGMTESTTPIMLPHQTALTDNGNQRDLPGGSVCSYE